MSSPGQSFSAIVDFQDGDLLLKHSDGSGTNKMIKGAQAVLHPMTGNADVVHAAIYREPSQVVEASGDGLVVHGLMDNLRSYTYDVYRYTGEKKNALIKQVLTRVQYTLDKQGGYSYKGAACSLVKKDSPSAKGYEETVPLLGKSDCFCSGAVVDWYNWAAVDIDLPAPFPITGDSASPQALATELAQYQKMKGFAQASSKWEFVGKAGKQ
jgi:hypothetical protein